MRPLGLPASVAAGLLVAAPLHAQSDFERFEVVTEAMNALMNQAFIQVAPDLEGRMPAPEWDEPLRAAYRCMYDGFVDEVGEAPVGDMITAMENSLPDLTPQDMLGGENPVDNPEGLSDERALEIVSDCQVMEVFEQRMVESGAMEILTQQ
ncbi:hypothetical protein V8J82_04555 [Gymnodinialimonas sp. 2305UL16-5]|uniref:hypothetical protein n=1 Tax=Gymnodinialimonas mytili TaxID=3126503 RepID=UPI0030B1F69D